jgi:hypothetical protein
MSSRLDSAMSSEDSANYSDAQSGYSLSADASPVLSGSSNVDDTPEHDAPEPRPKQRSGASIFRRSESLFLVLLFALIALLVPSFFFYASNSSAEQKDPSDDSVEARKSPLSALLPYVPAISTVFRLSFSASYLLLKPFITAFSFAFAILAPIFLAVNILFQVLVVLPSRIVTALAQFFYPIYLFCGTACIFGAGVGLGGRLLLRGSRSMLVDPRRDDDTSIQKGKQRAW